MTSRLSTRGLGRRLATITAAAMLVLGLGAASAFAAEIAVEPDEGLAATDTITVEGSGFEASTKYRIGLCSKEAYGVFGVPACGEPADVTADETGAFSESVEVTRTTANAHLEIPFPFNLGQPTEFTCAGDPEVDDECEIAITAHEGSSSTILARGDVSFE